MAQYDDDAPPPGYRYVYFGDPTQGTSGRYPVPIETAAAEPTRDVVGTSNAPSLPTAAPELQPEPSKDIAPHRYVAGEVPGGPAPEPTLDQMRYELAIKNLTPADWLMGAGENAASLLTSPIGMLGGYAGLGYHMLRGAPFEEANRRAADWAQASMYQPTTMAGQEIAEKINPTLASLPPVISGIMPGLMRPPKGTTGTLTAGVKRDVGQFSNDVFNAQHGITPGYPTMGSEFQKAFVEPRPSVYEMLAGLEPSNVPSTASAAVKTKGGNFPLSFDNDFEVSGQVGRHLDKLLKRVTPAVVRQQAQITNFQPVAERLGNFLWNTKKLSDDELSIITEPNNILNKYSPLLDEFISTHKEQFPQLKTLAELEALEQAEKAFITGQYSRYLTNEMGTGAKTDTLVRLAEQGIAVPEIAEVFDANYLGRAADLEGPRVLPAVKNLLTANKLKGIEAVQQTATTPYGKYIESLADEGVTPTSKKLYEDLLTLQKKLGLPTKYADKPTPFERIPEDIPIWDLPELWSNTELGLDRVLQKLSTDIKSGAIKPENVKNVSIESLVRGLIDENLKKLEAEKTLLLENLKATPRFNVPEPTQLSFVKSPGMTWIDIPETTDAKGLKLCTTLGTQAGWCTQDEKTARHYGSGDSRLTTLVDAEGRPHAQAKIVKSSVDPISEKLKDLDDNIMLEIRAEAAANEPQGDTFRQRVKEAALRRFPEWNNLKTPSDIKELKPPENSFTSARSKTYSRRDPEYKAKITDSVLKFLNAGEWGAVNDLGLYGILDTANEANLAQKILNLNPNIPSTIAAIDSIRKALPRFISEDDLTNFLYSGYAHGGVIHKADGGAIHMQDGGILNTVYNNVIPAHIRTYAETLLGDRSPITERNFSGSELEMMRDAIAASRKDRTATNSRLHQEQLDKAASAQERMALHNRGPSKELDQTVGYQHYPNSGDQSVRDDNAIGYDAAIRNTLGRFAYTKDAAGNLIATDLYKFRDDLPGQTRPTSDYANMSTMEKLGTLISDSAPSKAGLGTLLSRAGSAFMDPEGRPVNVNLGKASFADGGAVFNPQGADYDYQTARAHGMGREGGNWGSVAPTSDNERTLHGLPEDSYLMLKGIEHPTWDKAVEAEEARGSKIVKHGDRYYSVPAFADGGKSRPLSYVENKSESFADYRRGIGMKEGTVNKFEGGAVNDTLDKMVKNPQAATLLNLDLPNVIAAKQQTKPLKRGGKVEFSNNMDDMRYALTRR